MTLPSIIRIFFALDVEPLVKEKIGKFMANLKKGAKSHTIRWTVPENLHITLQFLAEVETDHLPLLIKNVRQQIEGAVSKTIVTFGSIQLFPNPYRPRVIVLETKPGEWLAKLAELVGQGIKATQYETEARAFRAHLTLGRIKHAQSVNLNFLSRVAIPAFGPLEVTEVVLFRSEPVEHGSKFTVLERIALTQRVIAAQAH